MKTYKSKVSILLLLLTLFTTGAFSSVANAADTQDSTEANSVSIEVANVRTDKASYDAGDTINGSYTIGNHSDFALTDLSYQLLIGGNYTEYGPDVKDPKTILDAGQKIGGISIAKDGTVTVPFTYKIPLFLSGEKLAVHIGVFTDAGQLIGWNDSPYISIKKGVSDLRIKSARIGLSTGRTFDLGEGPTIYENKEPKGASVLLSLTNESSSDITIYPEIGAYEQGDIKNTYNTTGVPFSIKAKEKKDMSIPLPTLSYKPGIYIGGVTLKDKAGNQLATRIETRYIIGGKIATVKSIGTDKLVLSQGESFNLKALVTGEALDISLGNDAAKDSGVGSITISLFNEQNLLVAEDRQAFSLSGGEDINKDLVSKVDSESLRAEVKVYDDLNNIILDYKKNLDDAYEEKAQVVELVIPSQSSLQFYIELALLLIVILIVIGAIYVFIRKMKAPSSLVIILVGILGMPTLILAAVTCVSIATSAPYNNQVFSPGQSISVRGKTSYVSCNNNTSSVRVVISTDFGQTKNLGVVASGYDNGGEAWVTYNSPTFTTSLTAPTTPGNYNVTFTSTVTSASSVCHGARKSVTVPIQVVGPTGGGSSSTNTSTNTNTNTNITRNCTPGIDGDCPETDLGKIITKARLGSSIASSANNTCPFFWTVGNEDADRKIECQLVTNGKITILPKLQPDTVNGQPLPIGLTKFICARGNGVATTTEEVSLSCSGNPNVIER